MLAQTLPHLLCTVSLIIIYGSCPTCTLSTETCISALGMESGAIKDKDITASSAFEHSSVGPHNARIRVDRNGGAWCPKSMIGKDANEWLQIDFKEPHIITGTESMGRFGNGQGAEFAEAYILEYWRPRLDKWVRYRNIQGSEIIQANENTYIAVKENLEPIILASKIRFHPYSPHQRTICMRVEVYGCSLEGGLLSYSMPQGDKRGTTYEFYDWNYDGEWLGEHLKNGLGALVDGDLGPDDYKLGYYAKNRGWVGWRNDKHNFVEIIFEFDTTREFHEIEIFCNNQFTRDVAIFSEVQIYFSISGNVYGTEPVTHIPLPDQIFENPRNVSVKLHRRVAKYLKVQLYFASKWMLISEVNFDSTVARGNYTDDMFVKDSANHADKNVIVDGLENDVINIDDVEPPSVEITGEEVEPEKVNTKEPNHETELSLMPIIVGALSTVIVLLAAIIFFIVSRTREKKALSSKQPSTQSSLPSEKVALNPASEPIHYAFFTEGTISESGSNSGSRSNGSRKIPMFDDNYNNRQASYGSPRTMRSLYSRQDSVNGTGGGSGASPGLRRPTPASTPRLGGGLTPRRTRTPQRRIINNPLSETAPLYMEPYHAMRYSPYARCGLTDLAVSKETAILSDTSCGGEYAVPVHPGSPASCASSIQSSPRNSGSRTDLDQNSDYVFLQSDGQSSEMADSLRLMKMRLENLILYQVDPDSLLCQEQISDGNFGKVYRAEIRIPAYGQLSPVTNRIVAAKFLSVEAGDREQSEFMKEVRLLAGLEDENISRVLGVCETRFPFFVIMEYLEHGDLNKFLRTHLPEDAPFIPPGTKTLTFPSLIYMATQIASGMKYLESLNFVHRDLATRNCLVGKAYHIKICDFGSDNVEYCADYSQQDDGLLIPLRWMAWESVLQKRFTTKSDVWSFGVCLWEILNFAGLRPYCELTDHQIMSCLAAKSLPMLAQPSPCPRDLYELMTECWNESEVLRPTFREIHLFLQRKNLGYSPN